MSPNPPPCEPRTFSFVLPAAMALTSNREVHYQVRAKRVREIRETVRYALRDRSPIAGPVDVDCALTWGDKRRRDAPNWWPSLKAAVDEIVALGVLPDDSNRYIRKTSMWPTEPQTGMKGYVRFVVTIRQARYALPAPNMEAL